MGEGSFGRVYLGSYKSKPTAIKYVFASNKEEQKLVEKEIRNLQDMTENPGLSHRVVNLISCEYFEFA